MFKNNPCINNTHSFITYLNWVLSEKLSRFAYLSISRVRLIRFYSIRQVEKSNILRDIHSDNCWHSRSNTHVIMICVNEKAQHSVSGGFGVTENTHSSRHWIFVVTCSQVRLNGQQQLEMGSGLEVGTYMMSPSFSLVCISAQLLWSLVVTARRRLGDIRAGIAPSSSGSAKWLPIRTMGEEPRRRVDMCRPATPPSILQRKNGEGE